jgi:hypothetical protein
MSQAHPPATIRRQQERDAGFVGYMLEGLSRRESELFWVLVTFLAGVTTDPLARLVDEDLADAAGCLAATYETAGRGLIYEHRPQSLASQRLVTDLKGFMATLVREADASVVRTVEREAAVVLRRVEKGAREAGRMIDEGPASAIGTIARVVSAAKREAENAPAAQQRIAPPSPMLIRP